MTSKICKITSRLEVVTGLRKLLFSLPIVIASGCDISLGSAGSVDNVAGTTFVDPDVSAALNSSLSLENIDPTSADFIESDPNHFRSALQGAWVASDCLPLSSLVSSNKSTREVKTFTATELIVNQYSYASSDCSGIPTGEWYPLPILSWSLVNYINLSDGTGAWELNTKISQRGLYQDIAGDDSGTTFYDVLSFVGSRLEFGSAPALYVIERPDTRSGEYFDPLTPRRQENLIPTELLGVWQSACVGRLQATYQFTDDTFVVTDENWADVGCDGESYSVRRSTFNATYGNSFTGIDAEQLISVEIEAVVNELLKFDDSQGLDQPEFKVPEGKVEHRAFTIDGDTLILGYCLRRNSGEDDCQDSPERTPDMVDYNWKVQFTKQ